MCVCVPLEPMEMFSMTYEGPNISLSLSLSLSLSVCVCVRLGWVCVCVCEDGRTPCVCLAVRNASVSAALSGVRLELMDGAGLRCVCGYPCMCLNLVSLCACVYVVKRNLFNVDVIMRVRTKLGVCL